jgi:integrase
LSYYRDEIRNGERGRYRVSKRLGSTSLSDREINKRKAAILGEVNDQKEIPIVEMNGLTFGEYIPQFLRVGMTDLKPSTRRSLASSIRAHLIPMFADTALAAIDAAKVQDLINSVMKNARSTRENIVDDLLMILDEARKENVVPVILKKNLKFGLKRPGDCKPFVLSISQVRRILKEFEGRKIWDAFFTLIATSGIRSEEIIGLRVQDLDFEQNEIRICQGIWQGEVVTLKTDGSETTVPMSPVMKAKLQKHLAGGHDHELVFYNSRRRPFSRDKIVSKILHPVLDKLGIKHAGRRCGLHAFRHTLTSVLLRTTGLAVAQRQMRHSDASTTLGHYGHVLGDDHRAAIDHIESVFQEPSSTD